MTRGYKPYRNSNENVLSDLKQDAPMQVILKDSVKLLYKIIKTRQPLDLFNLIRLPTWRKDSEISLQYAPYTGKFQKNMINKYMSAYNSLSDDL